MAFFRGLLRGAAPQTAMGRELLADSLGLASLAARSVAPRVANSLKLANGSFGSVSTAQLCTRSGLRSQTVTPGFSASAVMARKGAKSATQTVAKSAGVQVRHCSNAAAEMTSMQKFGAWTKANPILFAIITTSMRTAPCDLFAQLYVEERESVDWARFGGFMAFGVVYVAWAQFYIYSYVISLGNIAKLGVTAAAPAAVVMALVDQLVHSPFCYFPAFCLAIKMMEGVAVGDLVSETYNKWRGEVWDTCTASCALWIPAQMFNFYFMPVHFYVPFINLVGAVWVVYLSLLQGKVKASQDEAAKSEAL